MGKWAGAYRAEKRRKELDRQKSKEDKMKRLAARREQGKGADDAPAGEPVADAAVTPPAGGTGSVPDGAGKE